MDLSRLVKVRNGESLTAIADAKGLRVTPRKNGTVLDDAIRNGERTRKTISRIPDNYKPSRLANISSRQQSPASKTKYIVLDSRAINEIAEMSNTQRRNFLSRLSDSERRKVLRALRVNDGLEDGNVKRRDLNRTLEPQDLYVINDLLTKYAYSRKDDELRMLETYKDILDENDAQELAVLNLINKVIDGDLDLDADNDMINDVFNFLEDNGFETESLEASLNTAFGDTASDDEDIVGEEEGGDELDIDVEGEEGGEDEVDLDVTEDEGGEEEGEKEEEVDINIGDSAKEKPVEKQRVSDSVKPQEKFSDLEADIIDDSYNLAMAMLKGERMDIHDSVNEIIGKYTERCGEEIRVKDTFDRAFSKSIQQISNHLSKETQKIKDDIIEQIDEKLGEDSEETESATILESLGSALEAFANGDSEELQALSELTLEDINPQDEDAEEQETEDENAEGEEEVDLDIEGDDDLSLSLTDSACAAVTLAKCLLKNDKRANKIIDRLKDEVSVLKKYNFKISDSEIYEPEVAEDVDPVVEPLLSHDEFRSIYQYPAYVGEIAKEENPSECITVESVNYSDLSPVIQVETNGVYQNWIPIMGSVDKIVEQLEQDGADVAKIVSDNCVPEEDYYKAAAKTNNLGIVDSKFYKKKLSDEVWICDSKPEFIQDDAVGEGTVFAQEGITTMPKAVPSGTVLIYGTTYNYFNDVTRKNRE